MNSAGDHVERRRQPPASEARQQREHAENMIGPSTKPPATLAGTPTSDADPKVSIETGAVEARRGGDPDRSGSGPAGSAAARERPGDQEQAQDRRERELEAHVEQVLGFIVSSHGGRRQPQQPASLGREARTRAARATPATPARTIDGDAPVSSTYVDDHRQQSKRARQPADAEEREHERPTSLHSSTTFSPETAMMWSRPLRRKSSTACASTPSSSPSTMPCSTSRTGERRPRAVAPRGQAQAVDEALQAAAPAGDSEVGRKPRGARARRAAAGTARSRRPRLRRGSGDAHTGEPDRAPSVSGPDGSPTFALSPSRAQMCGLAHRDPGARHSTRTARVTSPSLAAGRSVRSRARRRAAGVAAEATAIAAPPRGRQPPRTGSGHDEASRQPALAADDSAAPPGSTRRSPPSQGRRRRGPPRAGTDGGRQASARHRPAQYAASSRCVAPSASPGGAHQRTHHPAATSDVIESFMAANLASPMPGTSLISSMVLKPPFSVR